MPVRQLPIVHKFGIISQSQRLELQERLLKQSFDQANKLKKTASTARNPLEINDAFVQHFNNTRNLDEKEKFEEMAQKMLERSKRRVGLKNSGIGSHVNIPMAWTELAQLSQCKGRLQGECLDVLITSLETSPLERYHIPALFFLAETMLYWLRTEAINQPYLRTTEIKLLKMGQIVFTRLFYSHMTGQLQGHSEFKNRLYTYLDGLNDCQEAYNAYPNALLSLRFIIEVGKIVLADISLDEVEAKNSNYNPPERKVEELNNATKMMYEKRSEASSHSAAISSSVHDLSPTLWHSLDVWRCTNQLSGGTADALLALSQCGRCLSSENWVDGTIALLILGDAARCNLDAMKVLHCLAQGVSLVEERDKSPTLVDDDSESQVTGCSFTDEDADLVHKLTSAQHSLPDSHPSLSDIHEKSGDEYLSTSSQTGTSSVPRLDLEFKEGEGSVEDSKVIKAPRAEVKREVSFGDKPKHAHGEGGSSNCKSMSVPSADCKAFNSSTNSVASKVTMVENSGIYGWSWEVAVTYCDILANISVHGKSVDIQKMALVGTNTDYSEPYLRGHGSTPLVSAGLIDLAFLHSLGEKDKEDWSWRLRYGAIQSLVKICRCLDKDATKDGLRNTAWATLLKCHSLEKDHRVLEAFKVGQVNTNKDELSSEKLTSYPALIGNRLAGGLSAIYLPPLPPPVSIRLPKKPAAKKLPTVKPTPRSMKLRTSLKDEIMLATALTEEPVDFNTRTTFDLRRIVEDQWRKELQEELEAELAEKNKNETDGMKSECH